MDSDLEHLTEKWDPNREPTGFIYLCCLVSRPLLSIQRSDTSVQLGYASTTDNCPAALASTLLSVHHRCNQSQDNLRKAED